MALTRKSSAIEIPFEPHGIIKANIAHIRCYDGESEEQEKQFRKAEERQWKANVIDLQRVLSISQALYLILEHNNEALLRVAMEVVLDPEAARALSWEEGWYSDDQRREWFRKVVRDKLSVALANSRNGVPIAEDVEDIISKEAHEALQARLEKMEGMFNAADRAKTITEDRCRELEKQKNEDDQRLRELEKANESLNKMVRELQENPGAVVETNDELVNELEAKLKLVEGQRDMAQERARQLEAQLTGTAGKSELLDAQKRLEALEKELKEQTDELSAAKKELVETKKELEKERNKPKTVDKQRQEVQSKHTPASFGQDKLDALMKQAEESARRASEAEAESARMKKECDKNQAEMADLHGKQSLLEARAQKAEAKTADALKEAQEWKNQTRQMEADAEKLQKKMEALTAERNKLLGELNKPVPKAEKEEKVVEKLRTPRAKATGPSQEEFDKMAADLEKQKERVAKFRQENNDLKAQNQELEDKNQRMLKMLHEIKEQLARVTEIANKRGLGDVIAQILEESKVSSTLDSAEYTCFNRLYDDAKRRQEKHRKNAEEKFGVMVGGRFAANRAHSPPREKPGPDSPPVVYPYGGGRPDRDDAPAGRRQSYSGVLPDMPPGGFDDTPTSQGPYDRRQSSAGSQRGGAGDQPWLGHSSGQSDSRSFSPVPHHCVHCGHGAFIPVAGGQDPGSASQQSYGGGGHPSAQQYFGGAHGGYESESSQDRQNGSLYATGQAFHLGGSNQQLRLRRDHLASGAHPAGMLQIPAGRHRRQSIVANDIIAVEGFNPVFGAVPAPRVDSREAGPCDVTLHARPFGLGSSASTGSLMVGSVSSPAGASAFRASPMALTGSALGSTMGTSPMAATVGGFGSSSMRGAPIHAAPIQSTLLASPSRGISAMSMDARGRNRSASAERMSSDSPPPALRRRLVESASQPTISIGETLPPLAIREEFRREETMRTSPASSFGAGRSRAGNGTPLSAMGTPLGGGGIPPRALHRVAVAPRSLLKEEEPAWEKPRTKMDEMLLATCKSVTRESPGSNTGNGGVAGWTLEGSPPP